MAFDSKKNAVKTNGRRIQKNVSEKKHSYSHERAADKDNTAPRSYQQFEYRTHETRMNPNERTEQNNEYILTGRNPIREALKNHHDLEKLLVQKGELSGSAREIVQKAKEQKIQIQVVEKSRLDAIAPNHQGLIAFASAYQYSSLDDILNAAAEKGEDPFLIILDNIEDPHNLGAIIRTANQAGAHGVVIPKHRAVGLTATVAKASAGAINYTPVAKVTNISKTMEELKEQGMWFVCADMGGTTMYDLNLTGSIGLVIGNEGHGVSDLVKKNCDMVASIPMYGDIDSLNASVACGVLAYEVVRQRINKSK